MCLQLVPTARGVFFAGGKLRYDVFMNTEQFKGNWLAAEGKIRKELFESLETSSLSGSATCNSTSGSRMNGVGSGSSSGSGISGDRFRYGDYFSKK